MSLLEQQHEVVDEWLSSLTIDKTKTLVKTLLADMEDEDATDTVFDFIKCPGISADPKEIATAIAFNNANAVAYSLVYQYPEDAKALFNELHWWAQQGLLSD